MLVSPASTRHYLHGDANEVGPNSFYCAFCDAFRPQEHFTDGTHRSDGYQRYRSSLKAWRAIGRRKRGKPLFRPASAENLFLTSLKPKKQETGRFYRWLKRQRKREDPIGDLARDVARDKAFPIQSEVLDSMQAHLLHNRACAEALQALEEAWTESGERARRELRDAKVRQPRAAAKRRSGLNTALRFTIFRRDSYRCGICGASAADGVCLEVDHKVPVAKGGGNQPANLWTLCSKCNHGKGANDL
jgi:5-methylcytosine-specific restriction endonuclease McrA